MVMMIDLFGRFNTWQSHPFGTFRYNLLPQKAKGFSLQSLTQLNTLKTEIWLK